MSYLLFLVSLARPTIQSMAIIDGTRNMSDNGPTPAFLVVGIVVTPGAGVVAVVAITVVTVAFFGALIFAEIVDTVPVVDGVMTLVLFTGMTGELPVPVPDDAATYPPPPPPPDDPPEDEYDGITVVVAVSKALLFASKSSFSEFPLLKGKIWNAWTPPTKNVTLTFPAVTSSSVEVTISRGSKLSGPPYWPATVVVNSPLGSPLIFATMTVPAGAGLPFRNTEP